MQVLNLIRLVGIGVVSHSLVTGCTPVEEEASEEVTVAPLVAVDPDARIDGQYIVVLKGAFDGPSAGAAIGRIALKDSRSRIEHRYDIIPAFSAHLVPEDLDALRRNPEVAYVEQDQRMSTADVRPAPGAINIDRHDHCPALDDGLFDDNYCTGSGVLIYIINSGIRATHTDFGGRVNTARGYAAPGIVGTTDCIGAGTSIASVAAGTAMGMASAATLIPVRVLNCSGSGTTSGVIAGVDHVRANCGATEKCVANLSLSVGASSALDSAVTSAVNSGIPFVKHATSTNELPAAIRVGCTTDAGYPATDDSLSVVRCSSSVVGADIWASATNLVASHTSDTGTLILSSVSLAAAEVTGAVAQLLYCTLPEPTPAMVETILYDKAISNAISSAPPGSANRLLCSDFSNDGFDACICP